MQFLADVELICEECKGMRFKPALLDVKYKGRSIHDVLNMNGARSIVILRQCESHRFKATGDG